MLQITISQFAFKVSLGNCQVNFVIKCGDKKEVISIQTTASTKLIKYKSPTSLTFEQKDIKYLQIFVESPDDYGYIKLLGSGKFVINDLIGKDNTLKIDLEHGNTLSLQIRCSSDAYRRNSASKQWSKSLREQPKSARYSSPPQARMRSKSPPQMLKMDSGNLKSSHSSIKQQKVLEECKQFLQRNVLDESEEFQQPDVPQPLDISKDSFTATRIIPKPQIYGDECQDYRQMAKELSLLLNVQMNRDVIVQTVQQLLLQLRAQGERLIKLECEQQITSVQLQNLQQQKSIIELKQEDFRTQIKQKLKTYKTLFEENVQLKNTLKEDLQRIVDLNIQIKELKHDQQEKESIESEIQKLKDNIDLVTKEVENYQTDYEILSEEINIVQKL